MSPLPLTDPHHMVIKQFLLLGLAATYICWRSVWSILPPTIRCLWHWPANLNFSAWDDQPLTYTQKAKKLLFEPPFRALRGNVRTPSMARWKARGRLYIRRNWTFFAISYGWDVISGNRSKSAFFEGGGSLWAQISERRGHRPLTTLGIRVAEWLPFRVV